METIQNGKLDLEEVYEERSFEFADLISEQLSNPLAMAKFTANVIKNAQEGDSASLKMIQQALSDVKYRNDKKQILTNEQLRTIISLTGDRLNREK